MPHHLEEEASEHQGMDDGKLPQLSEEEMKSLFYAVEYQFEPKREKSTLSRPLVTMETHPEFFGPGGIFTINGKPAINEKTHPDFFRPGGIFATKKD